MGDWFLLAGKSLWAAVAPSNMLCLLIVGGVLLGRFGRTRILGQRLAGAGAVVFAIVAFTPVGDWLLRNLEQRFPPLESCTRENVVGIILLGGSLGTQTEGGAVRYDLNGAADRIRYAAALAREYPSAPILISGGQVFPRAGAVSEAEATAVLLEELGIPPFRIQIETSSRTTAENAARSAGEGSLRSGQWALVTSAFHMSRAMGAFRHQGMHVVAAPTDYRVDEAPAPFSWDVAGRLERLDIAAKEYLGLLAYWASDRSETLFPWPDCDARQRARLDRTTNRVVGAT